jgi:hypothetical protein
MSVVEHHDVVETGDTRTDTRVAPGSPPCATTRAILWVLGAAGHQVGARRRYY